MPNICPKHIKKMPKTSLANTTNVILKIQFEVEAKQLAALKGHPLAPETEAEAIQLLGSHGDVIFKHLT